MNRSIRRLFGIVLALFFGAALVACTSSTAKVVDVNPETTTTIPTAARCAVSPVTDTTKTVPSGSIRVLAAASLTEAFGELAKKFQAAHPGTTINVSYGASSTLVSQLTSGAPADVLATADTITMNQASSAKAVDTPALFTCNRLALIVPKGNPKQLTALTDLEKSGVSYVVCAAPVPCGRFARQALSAAKVSVQPLGSEEDAKAVVSKVVLGEADAGIAYVTDAGGAPTKVTAVPLPAAEQVVAAYPIAVTTSSSARSLAAAFVGYVRSAPGQKVLAAHGFQTK